MILFYENTGDDTNSAFIAMARRGAERAQSELGLEYSEHSLTEDENRKKLLERYARGGAKLIIAVGFQHAEAIGQIAPNYPDTRFSMIDAKIPPLFDNVQSVGFRDDEGAFLIGMIAALNSKTGTIGFIGGMDSIVIRHFADGFRQGARYARPEIKIQQHMIGKTKAAFNDPKTAAKLAKEQIDNGADVLFAAAGGSATGMLEVANNYDHVYAIGVDTNQNDLYPGTMLTSLVKRVDLAVYNAMKQHSLNTWEAGIQSLGIKQGALDYAVDSHNRKLIGLETINQVERAKDFILQGLVKVEQYAD